ncbi:MAG: histidine triad nucleotide-binding protein [Elusimicrobiota bacterium]
MAENCLFCNIISKKIPAEIVFENEDVIAFKDINPTAPVHVLILTKKHIPTILDIKEEDSRVLSALWGAVNKIAKDMEIDESGFRVVANCGEDGGQEILHLHLHLLGGRQMTWPAG